MFYKSTSIRLPIPPRTPSGTSPFRRRGAVQHACGKPAANAGRAIQSARPCVLSVGAIQQGNPASRYLVAIPQENTGGKKMTSEENSLLVRVAPEQPQGS